MQWRLVWMTSRKELEYDYAKPSTASSIAGHGSPPRQIFIRAIKSKLLKGGYKSAI